MVDTLFAGWERGRGLRISSRLEQGLSPSLIVCANGLVFDSSSMVRALGLAASSDVVMVEVSVVFMVVPIGFTRFVGSGIGSGRPSLLSGGARRGSSGGARRRPSGGARRGWGASYFFRNSHQAILQGGKRRGLDPARGLGGAAFFLASHADSQFLDDLLIAAATAVQRPGGGKADALVGILPECGQKPFLCLGIAIAVNGAEILDRRDACLGIGFARLDLGCCCFRATVRLVCQSGDLGRGRRGRT